MSGKNSGTQGISLIIGKTIKYARKLRVRDKEAGDFVDDMPYLFVQFTDDTKVVFVSEYHGYTGNSVDEYPAFIEVEQYESFLERFEYYHGKRYELV